MPAIKAVMAVMLRIAAFHAGSAGASGSTQAGYPHNALPFAVSDGGTLYLEIENNRPVRSSLEFYS